MKRRPKGVSCYRDRHGTLRWSYRAKGVKSSQTRALFDSVEWWAWYHAAAAGERAPIGIERTAPGTLNALAVAYFTSSDWQLLSKSTQVTYRGILDRFRNEHGDKQVGLMEPRHIRSIMDGRAKTPAAANNLLKVIRAVVRFGRDRGMLKSDPTQGIKPLNYKTDGFIDWSEVEIAQFDEHWPLGTKQRLAKDLLLFTGQRSSEVRVMGVQHLQSGGVKVKQQKTGKWLHIPIHPSLGASLAACRSDHLTFLTTQFGRPYSSKGFGNWVSEAAQSAGLPVGRSAHGLRKAAARRLAEAGCTPHQIQAVTGHVSLKEIERYCRAASQKHLAQIAMAHIDGAEQERNLSNPDNELDKAGAK